MTAKGYATPAEVERFLSRTLSAEQLTQLGNVLEAAEQYIDSETGMSWMGEPVVDQVVQTYGSQFYLGAIESVQSLKSFGYGYDTPYTIMNKNKGQILINYPVLNGAPFYVSYTPMQMAPAVIKRATVVISAHWMMPTLDPDRFGVKGYQITGDYTVTFAEPTDIPEEARQILSKFGGELVLA